MSSNIADNDDPLESAMSDAEAFMAELQIDDDDDNNNFIVDDFAIGGDSDDDDGDDGVKEDEGGEIMNDININYVTEDIRIDQISTPKISTDNSSRTTTKISTTSTGVDHHPLQDTLLMNNNNSSNNEYLPTTPSATATTTSLINNLGGAMMNAAASTDNFKAQTSRFASNISAMAQRAANQMKQTTTTPDANTATGMIPTFFPTSTNAAATNAFNNVNGIAVTNTNPPVTMQNYTNNTRPIVTAVGGGGNALSPAAVKQQQEQQRQRAMLHSLNNEQKIHLLRKHVGDLLPGEQIVMFLPNLLHVTDSTGFQYRAPGGLLMDHNNTNNTISWCCAMTYYRIILFATNTNNINIVNTDTNTTSDNTNGRYLQSLLKDWNIYCVLPPNPVVIEMPLASLDKVEKVVYTATGSSMHGAAGVNNQSYMGLSITDKLGRSVRFTTTSYADTTRAVEALQTYAFVGKRNLGFLFAFESKRNLVMSSVVTCPNTGNTTVSLPANRKRFDPVKEFNRQGITRPNCPWKLWTTINHNYQLCGSYPSMFVGPARLNIDKTNDSTNSDVTGFPITDNSMHNSPERARHLIQQVALFRSEGRLPALTWMSQTDGASLWRCSQPKVGLQGNRSGADELLIKQILESASMASAMNPQIQQQHRSIPYEILARYTGVDGLVNYQLEPNCAMKIMDMRPKSSAIANRTGGYGYENTSYYPGCTIQFCNIGNIHAVRDSYNKITNLCSNNTTCNDMQWNSLVEDTKWLYHLRTILTASWECAFHIHIHRVPVLLHCSHGWDRTSQVSALAQILLDDYYRTCEGFSCLIEKDFMAFGHPFHTRCAHGEGKSSNSKDLNNSNAKNKNNDRGRSNNSSNNYKVGAGGGSSSNHHNAQDSSSHFDEGQISPIFVQFLDCLYQIVRLYPDQFEYNTKYIYEIVTHVYSCRFGNVLCDTEREREFIAELRQRTYCLWEYLDSNPKEFKNSNFSNTTSSGGYGGISSSVLLMPLSQLLRNVTVWNDLHLQHGSKITSRTKSVDFEQGGNYHYNQRNNNIDDSSNDGESKSNNKIYHEDVQKSIYVSINGNNDESNVAQPQQQQQPKAPTISSDATTILVNNNNEKKKEEIAAEEESINENNNSTLTTSASQDEDILI